MAITELALLHFTNNESITAPSNKAVASKLRTIISEQASFSKYPAHLLSQIEDPSYFYVLGGWDSLAAHMEDWVPSARNQEFMSSMADVIELVWLQHLELNPVTRNIPLNAPVIAVGRYFVAPDKATGYERTFAETKHHLEAFTAPRSLEGAWRVDSERPKAEFVLFSGWTTVEEHFKFAETDGFKEFGRIKEYLEGAEIKHVKLWLSSE